MIARVRDRLQKRYSELRESGGWRALADEIGRDMQVVINHRYVWDFCRTGSLPANPIVRHALLNWQPKGEEHMVDLSYPSGLERAILSVLDYHHGREKAIGRDELVNDLVGMGYRENERVVREAIKQLRRQGHLICSIPGNDGGYYLAGSLAEFDEFDRCELGAKIADMSETREAMRKAAREKFGEGYQMKLLQDA